MLQKGHIVVCAHVWHGEKHIRAVNDLCSEIPGSRGPCLLKIRQGRRAVLSIFYFAAFSLSFGRSFFLAISK